MNTIKVIPELDFHITELIYYLNGKNIITLGSCSGHGINKTGYILVDKINSNKTALDSLIMILKSKLITGLNIFEDDYKINFVFYVDNFRLYWDYILEFVKRGLE